MLTGQQQEPWCIASKASSLRMTNDPHLEPVSNGSASPEADVQLPIVVIGWRVPMCSHSTSRVIGCAAIHRHRCILLRRVDACDHAADRLWVAAVLEGLLHAGRDNTHAQAQLDCAVIHTAGVLQNCRPAAAPQGTVAALCNRCGQQGKDAPEEVLKDLASHL